MKNIRLYGCIWLVMGALTACTTSGETEKFPTDTNNTKSCAADAIKGNKGDSRHLKKT